VYLRCVSNEVADVPEPTDAPARPPLVLIAGDDDLVCVDDTCLPAEPSADLPANAAR
jgi:hypothetical protein